MDAKENSLFKAIAAYIPQFIVEERVLNPRLPGVNGRFREGTLVFADISGFTNMSEKLSELGKEGAEELTSILNRYFTHMLNIAFFYHGNQFKFGGDAMLLVFLGTQHAARGVRCALRMQEAMKKFSQVSTSQGIFRLEMSIGINSGEFFEASVGEPDERLYHILTGLEVNRTAQIESVANAGEIFIGPGTLHQLKDKVQVEQEREGYYQVKSLQARVKGTVPFKPDVKEKEVHTITEALAPYLPKRLVERIRVNPERAGVEGEHRRVTTMFVNLLGSSELIESYGKGQVDEITRVLNNYFLMVHTTVSKYGGIVVGCDLNTRGDKLLIMFGAPVAHEDDDERAVLCALEMRQQLADSGQPLQQRIGINTGHVFSGEVGSPLRKEYTVMGDQVNVAARLMGVAQEGQILIGESTRTRVASRFTLQALEPVRLKGKTEPVAVYQVEKAGGQDVPQQPRTAGALVGREKEMALLEEITERIFSGQGQALAITGPAGIGKSRLVEELNLLFAKYNGSTFVGNCQSYGANTPYLPWIDLLDSFFNIQDSDTDENRKEKLETTMLGLRPELRDWTAVIGNLLHVPIPESDALKSLDVELRHQRLLDVTLELIHARAERTPLLLLFEDLHWADTASIELLNYLARNIREYPILICAVYRPEEWLKLEAEGQDNYTGIALGELLPESSLDLVRSMVNMAELPQELSELVVTKSQGNPFFAEEVVGSLIDAGYLRPDPATGEYRLVTDLSKVEVPDTIQGVIMARLDRLEEETKNALRVASVIGRLFQYEIVRDIYPHPIADEELTQRLDELANLGLTRLEREGPAPEYFFKHI
jgi:class 3 adenylate cyclase/energy-coupling factor transporter ATP-binding protein EcfA2